MLQIYNNFMVLFLIHYSITFAYMQKKKTTQKKTS